MSVVKVTLPESLVDSVLFTLIDERTENLGKQQILLVRQDRDECMEQRAAR